MHHFIRKNEFGYLLYIRGSVFPVIVDAINTHTLIIKLIRNITVLLDKLSEYTCADTLQPVCCQASEKGT